MDPYNFYEIRLNAGMHVYSLIEDCYNELLVQMIFESFDVSYNWSYKHVKIYYLRRY